jgi:hypothetical protein
MTNLLFNSSFSVNSDGWAARNNASIVRTTEDTYYGRGAVDVTLSDSTPESGVYSVNAKTSYTPGTQVTFSAYVKVPEGAPDAILLPVLYFYNSSGTYVSEIAGTDKIVSSSDGWVRLYMTGMAITSTAASVVVGVVASDFNTYFEGARFLADAFLLEDGGVLTSYTEGQIPQDYENKAVNKGLTKLPQPHLTGMKLNADVRINGLTLNTIDENDIVWVCTDIQNWWNLPGIETPDIARGLDDGSYDVRGRRTARSITLTGSILVPDPSLAPVARQKLLEAVDLVYTGGWLYVDESPTKAAYVRLVGQPTIDSVTPRGRMNFSIPLRSGDPIKYSWDEAFNEGYTAAGLSNLLPNSTFDTITGWTTSTGMSGIAISTDYVYDGTYSLKVTANGGSANFGLFYDGQLPINGGDTYTFSAYVRDLDTAVPYRGVFYWYDVYGGATIGSSQGERISVTSTGWTKVSITAKAPENATYVWPLLYATSVPAVGQIAYFDAAELRKAKDVLYLVQATNLVANPSFESGAATGWATGNGTLSNTVSTSEAIDGTYSFRLTAAGNTANFGPYISGTTTTKIEANKTYSWSMYFKDANTAVSIRPRVVWYDASASAISVSGSTSVLGSNTAISNSVWTRVNMTATAPSNAVTVQPIMYANATPTANTVMYADYAEFREVTDTATTYIANNASNLNIVNDGNAEVAAVYKLTGPITAPAYIVSNNAAGLSQRLTILTDLRDNTYSASITASEFTAGIATVTTTAAHDFLVGDVITVDASNNFYDATSVTVTAVTDTSVSYADPTANITSITHNSNLGTVTTDAAHGFSSGTTFYISGSSNPVFDGAYTVVTNVSANVFTFTKTASNQTAGYGGKISRQISYSDTTTGTVTLAQTDTIEIDTYNKTVLYRGLPDSSRSTLAVNVDWIKLYPGNNIHTFSTTGGTGDAEVKYRSGWIG